MYPAGDQQVIQPNGQIHQLVKGDGDIPASQLPLDILTQTASVLIDKGPVVPSCSGGQGPKFQGELLGAPRPLPQVEEPFPSKWSNAASPSPHTTFAHSRALPEGNETRVDTLSLPEGAG